MSGMRGYLRLYMLALAASVGLGVPVMAQDSSDLAAGQNAWNRAGCYNCHGSRAQGGDGGDYAYTTVQCYGMPLGSRPADMVIPAILTADEIKALVDYVFATFVQKPQP